MMPAPYETSESQINDSRQKRDGATICAVTVMHKLIIGICIVIVDAINSQLLDTRVKRLCNTTHGIEDAAPCPPISSK